jgi:hypothetical protein
MARGIMIVHSNPSSPAREDDYNDWYTGVHLPELLKLDGIVSARRYRVLDERATNRYVAVYDIEADDVGAIMTVIQSAVQAGDIHMTDAIAMDPPPVVSLCEEL